MQRPWRSLRSLRAFIIIVALISCHAYADFFWNKYYQYYFVRLEQIKFFRSMCALRIESPLKKQAIVYTRVICGLIVVTNGGNYRLRYQCKHRVECFHVSCFTRVKLR